MILAQPRSSSLGLRPSDGRRSPVGPIRATTLTATSSASKGGPRTRRGGNRFSEKRPGRPSAMTTAENRVLLWDKSLGNLH